MKYYGKLLIDEKEVSIMGYDPDVVMFISLVASLFYPIICGLLTRLINKGKGYGGGFWWGFFLGVIGILVVVLKSPKDDPIMDRREVEEENLRFLNEHDGWECPCCTRLHGPLENECVCGFKLNEKVIIEEEKRTQDVYARKAENEADIILKYKKMYDDGLITESEFEAKKKQILGL